MSAQCSELTDCVRASCVFFACRACIYYCCAGDAQAEEDLHNRVQDMERQAKSHQSINDALKVQVKKAENATTKAKAEWRTAVLKVETKLKVCV